MKPSKIEAALLKLIKLTDRALDKAEKRGSLDALSRLIDSQRHNLKALRKKAKHG